MGGGWENRFPVQLVGGFGVAVISISFSSTFFVDSFQEIENNISQELFAAVDLLRAMLFGLCQKEHRGTEWSQNRTEWI